MIVKVAYSYAAFESNLLVWASFIWLWCEKHLCAGKLLCLCPQLDTQPQIRGELADSIGLATMHSDGCVSNCVFYCEETVLT